MKKEYFETIKFNNKEYICVDTYMLNNRKVYYFANPSDEVFMYKEDNTYIPITDNFTLELLKNIFGLTKTRRLYLTINKDELKKKLKIKLKDSNKRFKYAFGVLKPEIDEFIRSEQKQNFRDIKEKFGLDIDISYCDRRIDEVGLRTFLYKTKTHIGFYLQNLDCVYIADKHIKGKDIGARKIRLHEFIHAITGARIEGYDRNHIEGLLEGETENLVVDFFKQGTSNITVVPKGNGKATFYKKNFDKDTSYEDLVTIVKQMEYLIQKRSYESILKGDRSFEKEFIDRYGTKLFDYIARRTNRMLKSKNSKKYDSCEYLQETQDKLTEVVFDKDFENVKNLESATEYFEKLRYFEKMRQRKYTPKTIDSDEFIFEEEGFVDNQITIEEDDPFFKDYYNNKLEEVIIVLENAGATKEEIEKFKGKYKYQRQEFKPVRKIETEAAERLKDVIYRLSRNAKNEKGIIDPELLNTDNYEVTIYSNSDRPEEYFYVIEDKINKTKEMNYYNSAEGRTKYWLKCDDMKERIESKGFKAQTLEIDPEDIHSRLLKRVYSQKDFVERYGREIENREEEIVLCNELIELTEKRLDDQKIENIKKINKEPEVTDLIIQEDNFFKKASRGIKTLFFKFGNKIKNIRKKKELEDNNSTENSDVSDNAGKKNEETMPSWDLRNFENSSNEQPSIDESKDLKENPKRKDDGLEL